MHLPPLLSMNSVGTENHINRERRDKGDEAYKWYERA